jgi:twitching motility protein PilT
MLNVNELLKSAFEKKASDIHITVGSAPLFRINGSLVPFGDNIVKPVDSEALIKEVMNGPQFDMLTMNGEIDFSYSIPGVSRFRINAYKQRGCFGMALRIIPTSIPSLQQLGLPSVIGEFSKKTKGLVLVTGPTGSGKSTTLAALIDKINKERPCHILTLEDPIEYLHKHNKSMVNQREIGHDSRNYANALRAALRQDPDVILVGEMRDLETISTALTAAETGHLVLSTVHTVGAVKTMDRVIDVFPPHQQQQIRIQLASVLQGVVSQQLLPLKDNSGRVAAIEVMTATPAIRNLVREGKTHQIMSLVQTGAKYGMQSMDYALAELYKKGLISREDAVNYCVDFETLSQLMLT